MSHRHFLYNYKQGQVYKNSRQSTPELKDEIIRMISAKEPKFGQYLIEIYIKKWTSVDLREMPIFHMFFYIYKCYS